MNAQHSRESRTVIKSIIDLGHSLELQVTAEGVEDRETLDYLTSLGCDLDQGTSSPAHVRRRSQILAGPKLQ